MIETPTIWAVAGTIVFYTALVCVVIAIMALYDSASDKERRMKRIMLCFFTCLVFIWGLTTLEAIAPAWLFIGWVSYGFFAISLPIVLYHFTFVITEEENDRFPWQHYLIPVIYTMAFILWLIIVKKNIFASRFEDDATFAVFRFLRISSGVMRCLTSGIYGILGITRLIRFYHDREESNEGRAKVSMQWLALHVLLAMLILLNGIIMLLDFASVLPRWFSSSSGTIIIFIVMLIIASNSFSRTSLLYISITGNEDIPVKGRVQLEKSPKSNGESISPDRALMKDNSLTKARLEKILIKQKLYLDPNLRITDLTELLETNRTYLSAFINNTYGINYSRLVGRLRLQELARLKALPSNDGKPATELYSRAGFPSYRNYIWAKKTERERNTNIDRLKKK